MVETKKRFQECNKNDIQVQLQDYVILEKAYSGKKIVAILSETEGNDIWVWYGNSVIIDDEHISEEKTLRKFVEYEDLCFGKVNDKIKIIVDPKNFEAVGNVKTIIKDLGSNTKDDKDGGFL